MKYTMPFIIKVGDLQQTKSSRRRQITIGYNGRIAIVRLWDNQADSRPEPSCDKIYNIRAINPPNDLNGMRSYHGTASTKFEVNKQNNFFSNWMLR
jgi:hypothetical protein